MDTISYPCLKPNIAHVIYYDSLQLPDVASSLNDAIVSSADNTHIFKTNDITFYVAQFLRDE